MKRPAKRIRRPAKPAAMLPASDFADLSANVLLVLTSEEAARLSEGMADLLCWARGFAAACPAEPERHPMGAESTRRMRELLKRAIRDAEHHEPAMKPAMRTEQ